MTLSKARKGLAVSGLFAVAATFAQIPYPTSWKPYVGTALWLAVAFFGLCFLEDHLQLIGKLRKKPASRHPLTLLIIFFVFGALGVVLFLAFDSQEPVVPKVSSPSRMDENDRVGVLTFEKVDPLLPGSLRADKAFIAEVWFKNPGSYTVYGAQGYVHLVYSPTVREADDARIHRNVRKIARKEWETQSGQDVAVGAHIHLRAELSLTQEEIDALYSGKAKLYRFAMARWKSASGRRVLPEIDECSPLEGLFKEDLNQILPFWGFRCKPAPIPQRVTAGQIRSIDELREEGRQMLAAPAGHLPAQNQVKRWMEKAQLYLRTDVPDYLAEFDQCIKEPWAQEEADAWFNDPERQVEGRRLAAAVEFLDLIREELSSRLPDHPDTNTAKGAPDDSRAGREDRIWQIREELAPQLAKGLDLKNRCGLFGRAAIDHRALSVEAHVWAEEVEKYLANTLGQMAALAFRSANYSGATSNPGIGWDNFMFIGARVMGLKQVLKDLPDYVRP